MAEPPQRSCCSQDLDEPQGQAGASASSGAASGSTWWVCAVGTSAGSIIRGHRAVSTQPSTDHHYRCWLVREQDVVAHERPAPSLAQADPRLGFAVRSSRAVSHLAGGRVAAEPFPGTEAEEGAGPIGNHSDTSEELEEQTPSMSTVAALTPWPSPAPNYLRMPRLFGCNPTAARTWAGRRLRTLQRQRCTGQSLQR